jgi:hypothetical protein
MQINLRSTQTNVAFRKLFALPPEEFLIDDFTCHLKRKMPLQVIMAQLFIVSSLFEMEPPSVQIDFLCLECFAERCNIFHMLLDYFCCELLL